MPYNGTVFTLTCTIGVDENVDTSVNVDGVWIRGDDLLANDSNINISGTSLIRDMTYATTLTFSPLRNNSVDTGEYTCTATVISPSQYIIYNSNSDTLQLDVVGKQPHHIEAHSSHSLCQVDLLALYLQVFLHLR